MWVILLNNRKVENLYIHSNLNEFQG
jgi:hypothetical protein